MGLGALGLLSLVHGARALRPGGPEPVLYLLGVLPNLAAAVAIPFVVLGGWEDHAPAPTADVTRRRFVGLTLVAGVGLIGWELLQPSSRTLVFDPHDLAATVVGLAVGGWIFRRVAPSAG